MCVPTAAEPSARVEWFTQAGLMLQAQQAGLEASNVRAHARLPAPLA